MAFGSSGGKSNSSSSSSTNQTQTSTPTNPAWVTGGLANMGSTLSNLSGLDPYSLVPGANAQQIGAATTVGGLGTTSGTLANLGASTIAGSLSGAPGDITASAQAPAVSQLISHFMNPNIQSVVNPALAAFDFGAGQTQAQQDLSQAGTDSAFGGSGGALAKAATASQLALGRGQLAGSLYGSAYDSGLQGAENEGNLIMQARAQNLDAQKATAANRLQQEQLAQAAGTSLANLGLGIDSNARANATTQQDVGNNLYQIQANSAQAPVTLASALSGIWNQLPLNLLHGETDTLNGTTNTKGKTTSLSGGFSFG